MSKERDQKHYEIQLKKIATEIANIEDFGEIKEIIDKAAALAIYTRKADLGLQAQNNAAEIKILAERKAGALLQVMKESGERTKGGRPKENELDSQIRSSNNSPVELKDLGISGFQSHRWQTMAEVDEDEFENYVQQSTQKQKEITSGDVYKIGKKKKLDEERNKRQKEAQKKKQQFEQSEYDELVSLNHGDFYKLSQNIEENSIDHIITDPPYPAEFLPEWSKLSEVASRILKPGGFCITYSGKSHLPEVLSRMTDHLSYFWQAILLHSGQLAGVHSAKVNTGYKPILIFQKPPTKKPDEYWKDLIQGTGREKTDHKWQQAEKELIPIFEIFTKPNDLIYDPFMGSGTTLVTGLNLHRRMIGHDIKKENIKTAWTRIYEIE